MTRDRVPAEITAAEDLPCLVLAAPHDPVAGLIDALSVLVLKHPVAMQEAFRALVAEGRCVAETPEGMQWKATLARSELVPRLRELWEASALKLLEDSPETPMPTALLEVLAHALSDPGSGRLRPGTLRELGDESEPKR